MKYLDRIPYAIIVTCIIFCGVLYGQNRQGAPRAVTHDDGVTVIDADVVEEAVDYATVDRGVRTVARDAMAVFALLVDDITQPFGGRRVEFGDFRATLMKGQTWAEDGEVGSYTIELTIYVPADYTTRE